jgi:hypothetical protein
MSNSPLWMCLYKLICFAAMGGMFTIALFLYGAYNKGTTVIGIMLICHLSTKMLALHNDRDIK